MSNFTPAIFSIHPTPLKQAQIKRSRHKALISADNRVSLVFKLLAYYLALWSSSRTPLWSVGSGPSLLTHTDELREGYNRRIRRRIVEMVIKCKSVCAWDPVCTLWKVLLKASVYSIRVKMSGARLRNAGVVCTSLTSRNLRSVARPGNNSAFSKAKIKALTGRNHHFRRGEICEPLIGRWVGESSSDWSDHRDHQDMM